MKGLIQIIAPIAVLLFTLIYYFTIRPKSHINISLIGPTGSGKTTLLTSLQNNQYKLVKTLKLTKYEFDSKTVFDTPSCLKQKYEMNLKDTIIFLLDTKLKKIYFKVGSEKDFYLELLLEQILKKAKITLLFNNCAQEDLILAIEDLEKLLEEFIKESRADFDDDLKVDYSQEFFEKCILDSIKQKYAINSRKALQRRNATTPKDKNFFLDELTEVVAVDLLVVCTIVVEEPGTVVVWTSVDEESTVEVLPTTKVVVVTAHMFEFSPMQLIQLEHTGGD